MIEDAITTIMNAMFNTTFAGQNWLMYLVVITATLMIITRKWQDWGTLLLPVMVGWTYFGVQIPLVFLIAGAVIFVVDVLSLKVLAGAFSGIGEFVTHNIGQRNRLKWNTKRMDIREEMRKLNNKLSEEDERTMYNEFKIKKKREERLAEIVGGKSKGRGVFDDNKYTQRELEILNSGNIKGNIKGRSKEDIENDRLNKEAKERFNKAMNEARINRLKRQERVYGEMNQKLALNKAFSKLRKEEFNKMRRESRNFDKKEENKIKNYIINEKFYNKYTRRPFKQKDNYYSRPRRRFTGQRPKWEE